MERGGVCAWGRAPGQAGGGRPSLSGACGPHPTPVVHCCFRGGGAPAAARRAGGLLALSRSQCLQGIVVRSGWAAAAGAPGYEWNGAGLEPASGDSWEEAGFLRAGDGVRSARSPSGGGKLTSLGAGGGEAPVSSSERVGLWPLLETSALLPRPCGSPDWAKSLSLTRVTSRSLEISHHGFVFWSSPRSRGRKRAKGRLTRLIQDSVGCQRLVVAKRFTVSRFVNVSYWLNEASSRDTVYSLRMFEQIELKFCGGCVRWLFSCRVLPLIYVRSG